MCNRSNIDFARRHLRRDEIAGRKILEVGSRDVNGSLRHLILPLGPQSYTGVDIEPGPGVDELCSVHELLRRFGAEAVDVVVSTEVIEHVRDWRSALSQLKNVLKPHGILFLTTRSYGFPYHDYPADFWRYELEDMRILFGDLKIEALEADPMEPGVLVKARKPQVFVERSLVAHRLHSMISGTRRRRIGTLDLLLFGFKRTVLRRITESARYRFGRLIGK